MRLVGTQALAMKQPFFLSKTRHNIIFYPSFINNLERGNFAISVSKI
jgi:hypothetical protein